MGAAALATLGLGLVDASYATFSSTTQNVGNSFSAATLAAPSNFTVSQSCTGPGTAIAFRAQSTATGSSSLTLARPTGVVAGDVMIAQVAHRFGQTTLSAPTGWNLIRRDTAADEVSSAVYWKVAANGDPATNTFTLVGTSKIHMVGGIAAYSGVDTTAPVNASGARVGWSMTATTPSVTTTAADTLVLHTLSKRQEVTPAPAGTTSRWGLLSGTGTGSLGVTAADEAFAGPGATTARDSSTAFSAQWVAHTVALRPVRGTPDASAAWTASSSAWASGYRLERLVGGTVQNTVTVMPISATSATDGPLTNGTSYTYRLTAFYGSWASTPRTATLTPSC